MKSLEFTKLHGAGNDLIVLDGLSGALPSFESEIVHLCDRHFGVGADQLLVLLPSTVADVRMDIYDADGSRVEMCGNGIRAVAKYLRDRGRMRSDEISVETLGGIVRPRWLGDDRVRVDMGRPVLAPAKIPTLLADGEGPVIDRPLEVDGDSYREPSVTMGNPHAVIFVDDVDRAPVRTLGPRIEHHAAFPNRVNVEFVKVLGRDRLRQRTWERGTGETLACGSGACAAGVAAMLRNEADARVTIELLGGELEIEWQGGDAPVWMTGPAAEVFRGRFPLRGE